MKILVDTNILFAAVINPDRTPSKALQKALRMGTVVICKQNLDELKDAIGRKFPRKLLDLEVFLKHFLPQIELVEIPPEETELELQIRDVKDRTILRAAIRAEVDVILTGDRDFLECSILQPQIMTATDFIQTE